MKTSVLFILSGICLAECYKMAMAPSSENSLEYPRLNYASYAAIRELLSRLLFNANNSSRDADLNGNTPNSMEETFDFEVKSPADTDSQPSFIVIPDPESPAAATLLEKQTQSGQVRPPVPADFEDVNTNNNQPQNQVGEFSAFSVNENSPTPPSLTLQGRPRPNKSSTNEAVQPVVSISSSQSPSNLAVESNAILSQPPQSPQQSNSIESLPALPENSNISEEFPTPPQSSNSADNSPIPSSSSNSNRPSLPIGSVLSRPNSIVPNLAYLLSALGQNGSIPSAPHVPFLGSVMPSST